MMKDIDFTHMSEAFYFPDGAGFLFDDENTGDTDEGVDADEFRENATTEETTAAEEDSGEGLHAFGEGTAVEPTCTDYGYTAYTCTDCGEVFIRDIVEPAGHSYEAEVTEAAEDEAGYITYTCTVCGDTYTESLQEETEAGTQQAEGLFSGLSGYAVAGAAGFVIGAALAVIILCRIFKKKRKKEAASLKNGPAYTGKGPEAETGFSITVGKLHAQGARENQQDCFAVSPPEMAPSHGILAVVADGMGGLSEGEKVSQRAVSAMMDGFAGATGSPDKVLLALLQRANASVNHMLGTAGLSKSGSTMAAAIIKDSRFYYISVGDSRIALLRDGVLYQLNRDHVYCNDLAVDAVNGKGSVQAAFDHPKAHGLTSFIGMGRLRYVDIPARPITLKAGDRFVLMSDGVYNALTDEELARALSRPGTESAEYIGRIIQEKNYSTQDNYTAVILTVQP